MAELSALDKLKAKAAEAKAKREGKVEGVVSTEPTVPLVSASCEGAATAEEVETVRVAVTPSGRPSLVSALADLSSELAAPESAAANTTVVALGFELAEKLESLQAALLADHPRLPLLLRDIHSRLRDDPDTVTMLRPEDRGVIVAALRKHHRVEVMTKPAGKSAAAKASLKNITADDL